MAGAEVAIGAAADAVNPEAAGGVEPLDTLAVDVGAAVGAAEGEWLVVAAVAALAVTEPGVVVRSGAMAARALISVDGDCTAGVGSAGRGVSDPAGAAIGSAAGANGPPLSDNEAKGGGRRSALATVTRSEAARVRT